MTRILMVGDVFGKSGRRAVHDWVPTLRTRHSIDFVIVNGENAAGGIGITPDIADAMFANEVDAITLGNHAWGKREISPYLEEERRILRPANYPPGTPGRGFQVFSSPAGAIAVISLQGRTFMDPVDDPFRCADSILERLQGKAALIWVDVHAEATSEKQAIGRYLDGRVTAVIGTHTHVQTADERILPGGTGYLTDVGMTGPMESVIGVRCDSVLARFTTLLPARFEPADGEAQLAGVVVEADSATGRATSIERVQEPSFPTHRPVDSTPASSEAGLHSSRLEER